MSGDDERAAPAALDRLAARPFPIVSEHPDIEPPGRMAERPPRDVSGVLLLRVVGH